MARTPTYPNCLPTVMTPAAPKIERPAVHFIEPDLFYIELSNVTVSVTEEYGESHVDTRMQPAPPHAVELLTRSEMAAELGELLDQVGMSKTARATVERVLDQYGR